MFDSVWKTSTYLPQFEQLKRDLKTDVLIIGGGLAGILTAYKLKELGVQFVLVEANTVCSGVTLNTTAKITSQHGLIYNKIFREYGLEKAKQYYKANQSALKNFKDKCKNIDCNFEKKDAYIYSLNRIDRINDEMEILNKINAQFEFKQEIELPFNIAGAIEFKNQAQFNPLKFVKSIIEDLKIFEHTRVLGFDGVAFVTSEGRIFSDKAIITTHFPFLNKFGLFPLKLYQDRSYVIAVKNAAQLNGMYIDENETGFSFRNYEDMLFIGGGSHRTGKHGGNFKAINIFKNHYYPHSEEVCRWATQDCMSLDGIPYIGRYSKNKSDIFVATGFNKWGMTSSMLASEILADLVMGNNNEYEELFSPSRKMLHPQLFTNIVESGVNFFTPSKPRCPHLGCALKWNSAERSWDCPCHGSRFSDEGKLLENPSIDDLK